MAKPRLFLPSIKSTSGRRIWHGMAFIMEALVLLLFLIISMAILVQLFGTSRAHDENATDLTRAVILASNEAEQFHSEPTLEVTEYYTVSDGALVLSDENALDSFKVTRSVESLEQEEGTLFKANIVVEKHDSIVYELTSSRYMQESGGGL